MSKHPRVIGNKLKATLYADHGTDDHAWVLAWLKRWRLEVGIADYSSGGAEHIWDVYGPPEAMAEIPHHMKCASEWAGI